MDNVKKAAAAAAVVLFISSLYMSVSSPIIGKKSTKNK